MLRFVLRRLLSGVMTIVVISAITFLLLYASGGNIARRILGVRASDATVALKAHELGLDRPLIVQFWDWVTHAVTGDLGTSWFTSQPILVGMGQRLPITLSLVIGATIVSVIFGVLFGVIAATRGGWVDKVVQTLAVLGFAVPNFLIALGLVYVFALQLHWFAPTGYVNFTDDPAGWLATVTLPILALAAASVAGIAQQIRGSMIDAMNRDYVRTLRSRGLSENRIVYKHVLRNSAGPALALVGLQFVGMFGGAVIIETIFVIPGVGQIAVNATTQGDVPVVMGIVLITTILVVIANLLVDILQGFLNPKVRLS